jgi:hypothetical protein
VDFFCGMQLRMKYMQRGIWTWINHRSVCRILMKTQQLWVTVKKIMKCSMFQLRFLLQFMIVMNNVISIDFVHYSKCKVF